MASRFEMKASKHEGWMQGKPEKLKDNPFSGLNLSEVTVKFVLTLTELEFQFLC